MTHVDITALMQSEMEAAIEQKRGLPVDDENAFEMSCAIVGPGGQVAHVPMTWTSMEDKHAKMAVLSLLCKKVSAQAAIVTSDTRHLNSDAFCAHFKLNFTDGETYRRDYNRIMASYNHEMGRLPRALWEEALMVAAYGPKVERMARTSYKVVGREFVFDITRFMGDGGGEGKIEVSLIPAWWK